MNLRSEISRNLYSLKEKMSSELYKRELIRFIGAGGGIRTPTGGCPLPPQDSVSTSSTTPAFLHKFGYL